MSFTHKVTARNIFRYKKRMLMTIFGVCGAVTLLFAGLSVQHSIAGINDRQFQTILRYDLNSNLSTEETKEIENLLQSDAIDQSLPIYYTEMNQTAGKKQDKQEIKMIVPKETDLFANFISLTERKSGDAISLLYFLSALQNCWMQRLGIRLPYVMPTISLMRCRFLGLQKCIPGTLHS